MSTGPYDIAIIGSGMAGLYLATELLRKKRKQRIVVIEKFKELGGRASTFYQTVNGVKLQWEAGAGRISEGHTIIKELIRRYKLTWIPIGGEPRYIDTYGSEPEKDMFEAGIQAFLHPLTALPDEVLGTQTIKQILTKIHGSAKTEEYTIRFPYRAELETMRADMALKLFMHEFSRSEKYGIVAEGISAIKEGLRAEFEKKGGIILREHECKKIEGTTLVKISCIHEGQPVVIGADRCVVAVPVEALKGIEPFATWPGHKHLLMKPLLRFYGVFPEQWAESRIITSTPIRYVIPGNPEIGSIQMSYTDSQDADAWKLRLDQVGEKKVGEEILEQLRRLVKPSIPPPSFVRAHYWEHGVTYWLPGSYDPFKESKAAYRPLPDMPRVYLCGESYSVRQGWMEGAVEHAAGVLRFLD